MLATDRPRSTGAASAFASDMAAALDPVRLARRAGIEPDPWQARYLRSLAPRSLLNCSRQSGKSTAVGVKAVHRALYKPGALVLLLSPSLRQSGELFKKCQQVYHATQQQPGGNGGGTGTCGAFGGSAPAASETALTLTLSSGSRIVSLPGKEATVRGYSGVDTLFVDEASRVSDDLYFSIRPMLAVSGGSLDAMSTPFGTRGWWYEAFQNGGGSSTSAWERYEVPATQCPRISAAFLAEERENMGEWWFRQEYLCEFMDAQTQAFRREDIDRAFSEEVEAWDL